jgi:hypothetical protein
VRIALVSIGIAAALVASGSATVEQAQAAGMALLAATALVVLLEVVNVVGTWTWLVDPDTRIQWEAAIGVGASSLVTGICGVISYGLIGLVAPAGVLFTVHLVGRLTHRKRPAQETPAAEQSTAVDSSVDRSVDRPAAPEPIATAREAIDPPTAPIAIDRRLVASLPRPVPHAAVSHTLGLRKTAVDRMVTDPDRVDAALEAGRREADRRRAEPIDDEAPGSCRRPELCDADDHGHAPAAPAPSPTMPIDERARQIIETSDKRPSVMKLRAALRAEGYTASQHQCRKFLGYEQARPTTAELEEVS